tara:strand:+ start:471 stop:893 length:423 start_codon:yes stop_codon:yes gene_type:complete
MNYMKSDEEIIKMEQENNKNNQYKQYIEKRFIVEDLIETPNGLCAHIHDEELNETQKYHEGDKIADGKIQMIDDRGVVFKSPKAMTKPFVLKSKKELLPVGGRRAEKKRMELENEMQNMIPEDQPVIMISVMDTSSEYGL